MNRRTYLGAIAALFSGITGVALGKPSRRLSIRLNGEVIEDRFEIVSFRVGYLNKQPESELIEHTL